jgi:Ca-activated chloride channel homolog
MKRYYLLLSVFFTIQLFGQAERKLIREGNRLYENKKYTDAEVSYRKALDKKNNSLEAGFNIGNTLYKQGKFDEASKQFSSMIEATKDKSQLSKIHYNLGNSYFQEKKYQESVDAYKNALRNNPNDKDAKFNLSLAQRFLKQQQQQNKQDQNNKDNKDNKDKNKQDQNKQDQNKQDQNKQDQNKQDQNKQNQDKQDQNKQQQNQQGNQGQNKDQKDQQGQISAGDAERILEASKNDEKAVQMRLQQIKAKEDKDKKARQRSNPSKNW